MTEECTCEATVVLIFPCSGGSNCGQIANHAAVQLTEGGVGRIYCLAGIGAHDSVMLDTARTASQVVAIDGCSTACAKRTLEHTELTVTDCICVTNEGISKNHQFNIADEEVDLIARRTKELLTGLERRSS